MSWQFPARSVAGLDQRTVGSGARGAALLWLAGRRPPRDTIVFLHGLQPLPPYFYGAWLRHLAAEGNTIIYPVYQDLRTKPKAFRANAIAGISAGLRAAHADPNALVVIGYSIGGALAFDYAAVARNRSLPAPRAVLAFYPARNPPGGEIPGANPAHIPTRTLLEAVSGPGNVLPNGDAQARAMLRSASQVPPRRRIYYRAPAAVSPIGFASGKNSKYAKSNRGLWVRADRLIALARRDERGRTLR